MRRLKQHELISFKNVDHLIKHYFASCTHCWWKLRCDLCSKAFSHMAHLNWCVSCDECVRRTWLSCAACEANDLPHIEHCKSFLIHLHFNSLSCFNYLSILQPTTCISVIHLKFNYLSVPYRSMYFNHLSILHWAQCILFHLSMHNLEIIISLSKEYIALQKHKKKQQKWTKAEQAVFSLKVNAVIEPLP